MTMREHIKAIEIAARKMMPGEPCEEGACLACAEDRAVLAAISAALAAADERDKEFERAREAFDDWDNNQHPLRGGLSVVRAYFNSAKDGQ